MLVSDAGEMCAPKGRDTDTEVDPYRWPHPLHPLGNADEYPQTLHNANVHLLPTARAATLLVFLVVLVLFGNNPRTLDPRSDNPDPDLGRRHRTHSRPLPPTLRLAEDGPVRRNHPLPTAVLPPASDCTLPLARDRAECAGSRRTHAATHTAERFLEVERATLGGEVY